MKKNLVLVFALCAIPALLQAAAPMDPQQAGRELTEAAQGGDKDRVKQLLAEGADVNAVNKYGETALILAAREGQKDIVEMLLDEGADVEAVDEFDETPLILAAREGQKDIVKMLLDAGADVNAVNEYGETALIFAALSSKDIVEMLLDVGADVEAVDAAGETAEQMARGAGYKDTADLIRDYVPPLGRSIKSARKR